MYTIAKGGGFGGIQLIGAWLGIKQPFVCTCKWYIPSTIWAGTDPALYRLKMTEFAAELIRNSWWFQKLALIYAGFCDNTIWLLTAICGADVDILYKFTSGALFVVF